MDAIPGENILTGITPNDYVDAIIGLIDKPEFRETISRAGRERVLIHHNWAQSMHRLDEIIDRCLNEHLSTI